MRLYPAGTIALGVALILAACKAPLPLASRDAAGKQASPGPLSVVAANLPAAFTLLSKPKSAVHPLGGVVRLDAAYLISQDGGGLGGHRTGNVISNDGGTVVTHDGGSIIAAGGGNVITHDGGSLITNDGSTVISNDGGTVVAVQAGAIISSAAGGVISNDGGTMVAASKGNLIVPNAAIVLQGDGVVPRGGGVISNDGATVVTHDGGSYRLTQAAGASTLGTQMPAAGAWVRVISLRDNTALPLGQDEKGKPVYVIATDATGHFTAYLPDDVTENVRVIASVPNSSNARLVYNHVAASAAGTSETFDESRTLVSQTLRHALVNRLADLMAHDDGAAKFSSSFGKAVGPQLALLQQLYTTAHGNAAYQSLCLSARLRVVQHVADVVLSAVGLPHEGAVAGSAPAIAASDLDKIANAMNGVVRAASPHLTPPGDVFGLSTRAWALSSQAQLAAVGQPSYDLEKPSDVAVRIVTAFMGSNDNLLNAELNAAMADLGVDPKVTADLIAADRNVLQTLGLTIALNAPVLSGGKPLIQAMQDEFQAAVLAERACPEVPLVATVGIPTPGPSAKAVENYAGNGTTGADTAGPGLLAVIAGPKGIALDGQYLYVAEGSGAVSRIDTLDPARTVIDIAGQSFVGSDADGPGATARFYDLGNCAIDTHHHLFVTEGRGFDARTADGKPAASGTRVREIDLTPPYNVTTLAGDPNVKDYIDGPGSSARFGILAGIAIDGHGDVVVSDPQNHCLRKIDLHDPTHRVTTILGSPTRAVLQDSAAPAAGLPDARGVGTPQQLFYDAGGRLILEDLDSVRVLDTDGSLRTIIGGASPELRPGYWVAGTMGLLSGMAALPDGSLILDDYQNARIVRVRPDARYLGATIWPILGVGPLGTATVPASGGNVNGTPDVAQIGFIGGFAVDPQGTIYFSDSTTGSIRRLTLDR